MIKNIFFKLKTNLEHKLQNIGFFTGILFVILIFPIFFTLDYQYISDKNYLKIEDFGKLLNINTTLATILIGILMTTFSVVFVVMQLASSQFSPRILRYFMYSDIKIQQFIGLFIGAIAFVFLIQITSILLPNVSFTACILLSTFLNLYCLVMSFPSVITYLNDSMNVATITNKIKEEVNHEIEVMYAENWQKGNRLLYKRTILDTSKNHFDVLWNEKSGYLSQVNYEKLSLWYNSFIKKNPNFTNAKLYLRPIVGEFILSKTSIVMSFEYEQNLDNHTLQELINEFSKISKNIFSVNKYRSNTQDINFGVRKLVDIGIKAISPAVNDPTTCLNCIDYLGEILRNLSVKKFPSSLSYQLKNEKIFINEFNFDELVDFSFGQIYQWGKNDPVIVKRLINTLAMLIPFIENPYHLIVLIKEIDDMELNTIYDSKLQQKTHTLEQINSIEKELIKFKEKATKQIQQLTQNGILKQYNWTPEEQQTDKLKVAEAACIDFLAKY